MSMMNSQINGAISSTINGRVIPEIQTIMGSLSSGHGDTESGKSGNDQEGTTNKWAENENNKKDSGSAFDLRDTGDQSPYNLQIKTYQGLR